MLYVGMGLLAFGILFFAIGLAVRFVSSSRAKRRTARATAKICGLRRQVNREMDDDAHGASHVSYYPVLRFVDAMGNERTANQALSNNDDYTIGEVVEVSYDPGDPEGNVMMVRDEEAASVLPLVFIGVGVLIAVVGVVVLSIVVMTPLG